MDAEKYLERIDNTRLNSTPLYSRKEMIFFAKNYAEHYHADQLKLCEVNRSLPTNKQLEFYKLKMKEGLKAKGYDNTNINDFVLGFENCLYFINKTTSDNG